MKRVNIKMIAERTNLSPGTVSIILNGRARKMRISENTEKRVLEEAKRLGYQPNIYARRLRQQSNGKATAIIAILWPSVYSSELLVRFFDGIHSNILEKKINAEIVFKPYNYSKIHQLGYIFKDNFYNGVIIVGASDDDIEFIRSENSLMPIVFFNRQNNKFGAVCVDDYSAGKKVAELFSARGHKRVGLIESNLLMKHLSMRKIGFLDGCQQYGISVLPEHIVQESMDTEGGKKAMEKILNSKIYPTALFFSLAGMANGAYSVLQDRRIRIPEDMEIVGYGDTLISELLKPSMTILDLPVQKMVTQCLQLIIEMIQRQENRPINIFEETYFIFRESCDGFPT